MSSNQIRLSLAALLVVACSAGNGSQDVSELKQELSPYWMKVDWSMPPAFGPDLDGDGLIDLTPPKAAFRPQSFSVTVDACASAAPRARITSFTYRLSFPDHVDVQTTSACRLTYTLPATGGSFPLRVTANVADGSAGIQDLILRPKNYLIVSMGDSIASGEGNPDVEGSNPRWVDARCHRSAKSGPARAALALEQSDPHSSVTFLSVACSGAGIVHGIIDTYNGQQPNNAFFQLESQITQVNRALCPVQRTCTPAELPKIDALLMSIGANDAGFGESVRRCAYPDDCVDAVSGPVSRAIGALPPLYDRLDAALQAGLSYKALYLTEYPDVTHNDAGDFCRSVFSKAVDDNYSTGTRTFLGALAGLAIGSPALAAVLAVVAHGIHDGEISTSENRFAFYDVETPLNAAVQAAAYKHRWLFVGNIAQQFATHGYCANQNYIIRYDQSKVKQGNVDGTMHPNASGHQIYAAQLGTSLRTILDPEPPPPDGGAAGRTGWAFLWGGGATPGTSVASAAYSRNALVNPFGTPASSGNTVQRLGPGNYRLTFPRLGAYPGGNAQVTAYGSDSSRCKAANWWSNASDLFVDVLCFDVNGALVDSLFTASFVSRFDNFDGQTAYLLANDALGASYTPPATYQFNSTGASNTVTRLGTGSYRATFPGMNFGTTGGTVEINAYGYGSDRCNVLAWFGTNVSVQCYDSRGNPVDARFSLRYGHAAPGGGSSYAFAWADQPSAANYTPALFYQGAALANQCAAVVEPVTITRSSAGHYAVRMPQLAGTGSTVQVSAYGGGGNTCKVSGWFANGNATQVAVTCFNAAGQVADGYFVVTYITDQYGVC